MRWDITSLLAQEFATARCDRCGALHPTAGEHCAVCSNTGFLTSAPLRSQHARLDHAVVLARIAETARVEGWKPYRLLLELLARSRWFVHFATFGITLDFVGVMKATSARVPVWGWVSKPGDKVAAELTEFPDEAPGLRAEVFRLKSSLEDVPHQKLVVVDGIVALDGSTNLTSHGYRKADRDWDRSRTVTNVDEVVELNNRYFSAVWAELVSQPLANEPRAAVESPSVSVGPASLEQVELAWRDALSALKPLARALYKDAAVSLGPTGEVVLALPNPKHRDRCASYLANAEQALSERLERSVQIELVVLSGAAL